MTTTTILEDKREIRAIWTDDHQGNGWSVYHPSPGIYCTRIVAYREQGPGGYVPWLAVFDDDALVARVPAHQCVSVEYQR